MRARWTLTRPTLTGAVSVVATHDGAYVLQCGADLVLARIDTRGDVQWKQPLGPCFNNERVAPLAVSSDGPLVAMLPRGGGGRVVSFDGRGVVRWDRKLGGSINVLGVTAHADRAASSRRTRSTSRTLRSPRGRRPIWSCSSSVAMADGPART
jgi:outer membrane protein assembly factor BamB